MERLRAVRNYTPSSYTAVYLDVAWNAFNEEPSALMFFPIFLSLSGGNYTRRTTCLPETINLYVCDDKICHRQMQLGIFRPLLLWIIFYRP